MRELKVRIWDIHHNEMLDDLHFDKAVSLNEALKSNEDFIVMLSTGKLDKNGIEIFEGDILFSNISDDENVKNPTYFIAEWDNVNLSYCLKNTKNNDLIDLFSNSVQFEVVGNKYKI